MKSLFIYFILLSSGSLLGASLWRRKYEEMLPITNMATLLVLFLFGVVSRLIWGFYFLIIIALSIYVFCMIIIIKEVAVGNGKTFAWRTAKNFFSFGFCVFTLFYIWAVFSNAGRLLTEWDEFSHWGTVVKQMTITDTLATDPRAVFVTFKSYPPTMALFQYFYQKLNTLLGGDTFSEWRLYLSYQVLMISVLLPFVRKFSFKNASSYFTAAIIFVIPEVIFHNAYSSIYIDCFLGVSVGAGFGMILDAEKKSFERFGWVAIYVAMLISTLVLTKAVGILFAVFLGLALITRFVFSTDMVKKRIIRVVFVLAAVFIPFILWSLSKSLNDVGGDSTISFNLSVLLDIIFGKDNSWRAEASKNFLERLFVLPAYAVSDGSICLSYQALILIFMALSICLIKKMILRREFEKAIALLCAVLSFIVYIIGLWITYLFHFSTSEAVGLASFGRYVGVALESFAVPIIICLLSGTLCLVSNEYLRRGIILLSVILLIPVQEFSYHLTGQDVKDTVDFRYSYDTFCKGIEEYTEEDSYIYLIDQWDSGGSFWICKYILLPRETLI